MRVEPAPTLPPSAPTFGDPSAARAFLRDGWVVTDLLDAEEVATLARVFDAIVGAPAEPIYSSWSQALSVRAQTDAAIRSVTLPRLCALLPRREMVFAGFMAKAVSPDTAFPIHQDPTIVDEERWTPLTFWVPLVAVEPETGCMQGVPGSHRWRAFPRPAFRAFPYQHEDARLRPLLRPIPMRAGQVLLAHPALFHASTPNLGAGRRVACVGTLVPDDAEVRYYRRRETEPVIDAHPVPSGFYVRVRPEDATDGLPVAGRFPDQPPPLDLDALVALGAGASV
ncbi:MAG: phytanoyl-CoA dioxygenase family protein [Deltaproteobacteria bacterium]|nr:phytanoyl-CoA dioxygenase family protein [Deltaproteobacteria bacterium]